MKIVLDTNFLLIPYQFNVDIFEEIRRICNFKYRLYIVDKTIDELEKLVEKERGKDKDAAKLAMSLIKHKDIKIIPTDDNKIVDDLIVDIAEEEEIIVATNDKELKEKLKQKNIRLIILRQKKYLKLL